MQAEGPGTAVVRLAQPPNFEEAVFAAARRPSEYADLIRAASAHAGFRSVRELERAGANAERVSSSPVSPGEGFERNDQSMI